MEAILPELIALDQARVQNSSVEIYQGFKGVHSVLSDVFAKKQVVKYFGSYSLSLHVLKHQPEHFRTLRFEKKIPAKIVIDKPLEEVFDTKSYKSLTSIRFNSFLENFPLMVFIYGRKVAMYTLKNDLVGVIIDNNEVAIAMEMMFHMYWNQAKP